MKENSKSFVFLHKTFPFGGAEKVTMDMANYFVRQNYKVAVLVAHHNPPAYPSGFSPLFDVVELPSGNIKISPKIARFIRDYVQKNNVTAIITYREILYAQWLRTQTKAKIIFALMSKPGYEFSGHPLMCWFYRLKYRRVYQSSDIYGVICEYYIDELRQILSLPQNAEKIKIIPCFITLPHDIRMPKQKNIIYVGRLSRRDKRLDRLLRIWQQVAQDLPEWNLKIVGQGPDEGRLRRLAQQYKLPRIFFEGYSHHVQDYYDEASLLCITSSFEGWPLCVAEAQANGVIPLAFNSFGGARDLIQNPDEGVLVPPFDEAAYASQLVKLANDPGRMARMQHAVLKKSLRYSVENAGTVWLNSLQS